MKVVPMFFLRRAEVALIAFIFRAASKSFLIALPRKAWG